MVEFSCHHYWHHAVADPAGEETAVAEVFAEVSGGTTQGSSSCSTPWESAAVARVFGLLAVGGLDPAPPLFEDIGCDLITVPDWRANTDVL